MGVDPRRLPLIDIEASSLSPQSYPVEIAWSIMGTEIDSVLINPDSADDWTDWDQQAEALHGISRSAAVRDGVDVMVAAQHLNECLGGLVVLCDGLEHDRFWLHRLFDAVMFQPAFRLSSLQGWLRLNIPAQEARFNEQTSLQVRRHRAGADVRALRAALVSCLDQPV